MNGLYWMVWVLYGKRAGTMVLSMQLECEWVVFDSTEVSCEACRHHGVIDAARERFTSRHTLLKALTVLHTLHTPSKYPWALHLAFLQP